MKSELNGKEKETRVPADLQKALAAASPETRTMCGKILHKLREGTGFIG